MKHYSIDYSLVYEASCDLSRAYEKLLSDDMEIAKVLIGYAKDKLDRFSAQDNLVEDYDCADPLIKLSDTCLLDEMYDGSEEDLDIDDPSSCTDCVFYDCIDHPFCEHCVHNEKP